MKKHRRLIENYIWFIILIGIITGCGKQKQEAAEQSFEREEVVYEGNTTRYLIGIETIYEVLEDKTIIKRFEANGNGLMDVVADKEGTLYISIMDIIENDSDDMVLYQVKYGEDIKEIYRADYYPNELIWKDNKVVLAVSNYVDSDQWFIVYDIKTDQITKEEYQYGDEFCKDAAFKEHEKKLDNEYNLKLIAEIQDKLYYLREKEEQTEDKFYELCENDRTMKNETVIMDIAQRTHQSKNFSFIDDDIYFRCFDGKKYKWMRYSLTKEGDIEDLDKVDYMIWQAKYGSMIDDFYSFSNEEGKKTMSVDLQKFYFDETFPNGKKMNEALDIIYNQTIGDMIEENRIYVNQNNGNRNFREYITQFQIFQEHYLKLDIEIEWYKGYQFFHLTFDTNTGDLLTLQNKYTGTEEQFKKYN